MKIHKIIIIGLSLLMLSSSFYAQDNRTTETKVADLLARLPANDLNFTNQLMGDMLSIGENGIKQICDQIIPSGTGDDTSPRFAVESFSRFLSQKGKETEKEMWEKICISYATGQKDNGVKDFFMKQLQLIGGDQSAEAMKIYLGSKEICQPALAVITAVGGKISESILAESLKNHDLPCAAAVMNSLANNKSQMSVNEYIIWASNDDINIKASAYNALAQSGSPLAYPVLLKAAKEVLYRWELTGATSSLLNYAKVIGQNGDKTTMDKICKLIIKKCNDNITIQNKIVALDTYVSIHGIDAMPVIIKAAAHSNSKYRCAAMRMSLSIPGSEVTGRWINYFPKAIPDAKPEIITMLGDRGDELALPLVTASLSDNDLNTRREASEAIVKIGGSQAINSLINYMLVFSSAPDQEAAKSALMTVAGNDRMPLLIPVLKDGSSAARKSVIELLAWNRDNKYFSDVLSLASSTDEMIKEAALKALANLAGPNDQGKLLQLLSVTDNTEDITDIQTALVATAGKLSDPGNKLTDILKAMDSNIQKEKIIPVLAKTGERKALAHVLNEFENGNPEMRKVCFKALTTWCDYSASSALYEICASGNKTYESPAFEGYVKQIKTASLPDEQKLLLFRKIMPYALSADRKKQILNEIGNLKTYQALYFIAKYLDDQATSAVAAKAAMKIALPSINSKAGMYGDMVKEFLLKTTDKLTGQESEYDKEMINKYLAGMPADEGFKPMFNGKDLSGWQGLVENPVERGKMKPADLAKKQAEANKKVSGNWSVKDGCIWFNGSGENLCSIKEYGDFEMITDWKITKAGDSGIYLRGSPQVQIWDTSRVEVGAQVGSGGLYNNQKYLSKPVKVADNPVGDWNTFKIVMIGEKVSVWLNGELVVDNVIMENYWDSMIPIFPKGAIELQAHGTDLAFRDIYVREISEKEYNLTSEEKAEGFVALFNGRNLNNWLGNKESYVVEDAMIVIKPDDGSGGNLYTEKEYADFIFRFEFQLTPEANNGLGIRAPLTGDAAYVGMELQILDNTAPVYANLQPYQYHGSVYGVIPALRGYLKPVGEWNYEEVIVKGTRIKIILNGTAIVDGDIANARDNGTMDHNDHPGLKNKTGHIGFLGHGSELNFRNIRIKDLSKQD
ncbi:MAG TPA: family 16 glycoside hydrolase [Bacteroidales bacterium]|nr:family 16 glycoside hydrolase [Bacteroidales bacterium]